MIAFLLVMDLAASEEAMRIVNVTRAALRCDDDDNYAK